jgi:hypothetical protein
MKSPPIAEVTASQGIRRNPVSLGAQIRKLRNKQPDHGPLIDQASIKAKISHGVQQRQSQFNLGKDNDVKDKDKNVWDMYPRRLKLTSRAEHDAKIRKLKNKQPEHDLCQKQPSPEDTNEHANFSTTSTALAPTALSRRQKTLQLLQQTRQVLLQQHLLNLPISSTAPASISSTPPAAAPSTTFLSSSTTAISTSSPAAAAAASSSLPPAPAPAPPTSSSSSAPAHSSTLQL